MVWYPPQGKHWLVERLLFFSESTRQPQIRPGIQSVSVLEKNEQFQLTLSSDGIRPLGICCNRLCKSSTAADIRARTPGKARTSWRLRSWTLGLHVSRKAKVIFAFVFVWSRLVSFFLRGDWDLRRCGEPSDGRIERSGSERARSSGILKTAACWLLSEMRSFLGRPRCLLPPRCTPSSPCIVRSSLSVRWGMGIVWFCNDFRWRRRGFEEVSARTARRAAMRRACSLVWYFEVDVLRSCPSSCACSLFQSASRIVFEVSSATCCLHWSTLVERFDCGPGEGSIDGCSWAKAVAICWREGHWGLKEENVVVVKRSGLPLFRGGVSCEVNEQEWSLNLRIASWSSGPGFNRALRDFAMRRERVEEAEEAEGYLESSWKVLVVEL